MTKPTHKARRADDWVFDMPAGRAVHAPTGLEFQLLPIGSLGDTDRFPVLQAQGLRAIGEVHLPPDTNDRRQVQIDPGDANAPHVSRWAVLVPLDAYNRARDVLLDRHGPSQARDMLQRVCREAGERWIFRARMERGWADGRRFV